MGDSKNVWGHYAKDPKNPIVTSVYARITTKMEFIPEVPQHSDGVILYYDNIKRMNRTV